MGSNPTYGSKGYNAGNYNNTPIEFLPIGYYQQLLTHQYRITSPKWQAFLFVLLKKFDDVTMCAASLDYLLYLDNAEGAQLDQIGALVGANRVVGFQPSNGISPTLDDVTYRLLIKAQIVKNRWNGTIGGLQAAWETLFPGGTIGIKDNQNMTADVILAGTFTSIVQDLILNGYIVPRPEGVMYNYIFGVLPFFGFGSLAGVIAGFGQGHWA